MLTLIELQPLIEEGLTQREIASRLRISQTTVRYWLKKLDVQTKPKRTGCKLHGVSPCVKCKRGSAAQVTARRRKLKEMVVMERGGRCEHPTCPVNSEYQFELGDLEFHHRDRQTKARSLANWSQSEAAFRAEVVKCDLLCALCHRRAERDRPL